MVTIGSMDIDKLTATCEHLTKTRLFVEPLRVYYEDNFLVIDTCYDTLRLEIISGDAEWFLSAQALGGLMCRVLPHPRPDCVSIAGAWEEQFHMLVGVVS